MEEQISTTSEVETQTTPEVQEETQTSESPATEQQEPETQQPETEIQDETPEEKTIDWEKQAKNHQAAFTKSQQELSELKKKIEQFEKPKEEKIIDSDGKISKEFQENYQLQIDNNEYMAYDNLSRQVPDIEVRQEIESILREAQNIYQYDKNAYSQKMNELKQYFAPSIVEQIAKNKFLAEQGLEKTFNEELAKDRQEKAKVLTEKIQESAELNAIVNPDSENYSPEVLGIVKDIFNSYGTVDIELTTKAISSIKALGVKEYIAKQEQEKAKTVANVPTGNNVQVSSNDMPTAKDLNENPALYTESVKKYGMEKIDAIIMKG